MKQHAEKTFQTIENCLSEAGSMAAVLGTAVCNLFRKKSSRKVLRSGARAVLLVHGYLNEGRIWSYHQSQLEKEGYLVYTIDLGSPMKSITAYAEQVYEEIKKIKKTGCRDIALIGYSMGGLVCCYCAAHLEKNISQVITIGSPLNGTPLAYLGLGQCARDMQPDSPFLKKMQKAIRRHPDLKIYHIASTDDFIVPISSSVLPEADDDRVVIIEDHGHNNLLFSPLVSSILTQMLQSENKRTVFAG